MILKPDDHVLFFGDSITDAGRRNTEGNNNGLGAGYPALVAAILGARFPGWNLRFTNRGISGNRVTDLQARLEEDVLALKPTLVSILIGINDTWHQFKHDKPSPHDAFETGYRCLLQTLTDRIAPRILLLEPFLLPTPADRIPWRSDLDARIDAIRRVAVEFGVDYVPLDGLFAAAACQRPADYWLPDGVHPSPAGHGLIAEAWISRATS